MELLQLRYFATVAKYQNISRAAAEYAIPQPAMSRTIARLERELGMPLFDRRSNRITLNKNGQRLYAAVLDMLCPLDDCVARLKAEHSPVGGELRLLILQSRNMVIDLVAAFSRMNPGIRFLVYHSSVSPDDFDFDFCLASENFGAKYSRRSLLFTEEIMLAVNDAHPLAQRKYVTADELRQEKFIAMPYASELTAVTQKICRLNGFEPDNIILCDDPFYVRKYVSLGMGVAFAPAAAWNGLWPANVVLVHIEGAGFTRSTYLYEKSGRPTAAYEAFRTYLRAHLSRTRQP